MLVTRFAPSPTGQLHLGHAYSALRAFDAARAADGRFLLRIEDIDRGRCRPEYEAQIYEDLEWLGLKWETPVRRQSDHMADYQAALDQLRALGLVYRCFKTRREVMDEISSAPHDIGRADAYVSEPLPETEESARLDRGEAFAWRLNIAACRDHLGSEFERLTFFEEGSGPGGETGEVHADPAYFGHAVIARKDAGTSYHLASVHDDALQGVTHIIRGRDLFHATFLHRLLQALFGWPTPRYRHHRLLTDAAGQRFSKRTQSMTLATLRASGMTPEQVRANLPLGDEL